jgi:FdhE protein
MSETWERRIQRATDLARCNDGARSLLVFYADLLALQKQLYDHFRARSPAGPTGALDGDGVVLRDGARTLLAAIANHSPGRVGDDAGQLLASGDGAIDATILAYWQNPSDQQFVAKALLQPYMQWLAENGIRPANRPPAGAGNRCPVCGGAPQAAVLEKGADGEGAARHLLCATCLAQWPVRRVWCVSCGEEDERRLAYFRSPEFDHLRIDACETCMRYIKTVDRTRLGLAVPLVDEVASASLDIWARERGFQKIEINLVGV